MPIGVNPARRNASIVSQRCRDDAFAGTDTIASSGPVASAFDASRTRLRSSPRNAVTRSSAVMPGKPGTGSSGDRDAAARLIERIAWVAVPAATARAAGQPTTSSRSTIAATPGTWSCDSSSRSNATSGWRPSRAIATTVRVVPKSMPSRMRCDNDYHVTGLPSVRSIARTTLLRGST